MEEKDLDRAWNQMEVSPISLINLRYALIAISYLVVGLGATIRKCFFSSQSDPKIIVGIYIYLVFFCYVMIYDLPMDLVIIP